ncbi:hypothetical protein BAUCODRAFT_160624 [Baudoinia panamericana UAMH 10762]|uniref:FAR-17a/AIG1-like protein n=1 Tax=Baudoinia panamericana (strain UAMH 10762) TaxID=717646 RepID=M2MXT1_BAUPA|nr:uncharacterized protein BAUCODRAFT_160624 [Baudoinia panamericana UAMH 10762]EMC91055.1 hypothetical protein BAUCODRAFT_160624 [Baudoinia panamericana UAMH 10762]
MAADDYARMLVRQHPLQRLPAPSRGASALLHTVGLCSFTYSFSYLVTNPNPVNDSYGWHLQYLTIIGLSLATITFAIALLADITLSRRLFAFKNWLSVASAPMECLITMLYWGLRAIDPKLVLPDWAPPLSRIADLSFHAAPSIALVTDLLFFSPPYTIAFLPALGLSGIIAFGYWLWIEQCYHYNNFYPYPIFTLLNTQQRIGLFAGSALLMTLSTGFLTWVYGVVNGTEQDARHTNGDVRFKERSGNIKGE